MDGGARIRSRSDRAGGRRARRVVGEAATWLMTSTTALALAISSPGAAFSANARSPEARPSETRRSTPERSSEARSTEGFSSRESWVNSSWPASTEFPSWSRSRSSSLESASPESLRPNLLSQSRPRSVRCRVAGYQRLADRLRVRVVCRPATARSRWSASCDAASSSSGCGRSTARGASAGACSFPAAPRSGARSASLSSLAALRKREEGVGARHAHDSQRPDPSRPVCSEENVR